MGKQPLAVSRQRSAKTWGDIFWKYVGKGFDRTYAAHMADRYEARQIKKEEQCETSLSAPTT